MYLPLNVLSFEVMAEVTGSEHLCFLDAKRSSLSANTGQFLVSIQALLQLCIYISYHIPLEIQHFF